jgi:hypothetical protein
METAALALLLQKLEQKLQACTAKAQMDLLLLLQVLKLAAFTLARFDLA